MRICVPWIVEAVIRGHRQSSDSKSLNLEGMSDEVCILKRSAELTNRILLVLLVKCPSGPRPFPGPVSGQNFSNKAVKPSSSLLWSTMHTTSTAKKSCSDPPSLRRAPHSQESRSFDCRRHGRHGRQLLSSSSSDDHFSTTASVPIKLTE